MGILLRLTSIDMPFEAALLSLAANGGDSSTTALPVVVTTYDTPCYGAYPYGYYDYGYGYGYYGYGSDYGYGYGYPAYTYYPGYYYYPAMAESGTSQQLAVLPQAPSLPAEGTEST